MSVRGSRFALHVAFGRRYLHLCGVKRASCLPPVYPQFPKVTTSEMSQKNSAMKYILVTGGVISGVGKGVIASSFGTILKCCGINVTSIKIDPYINIDAGTFSPYEHGKLVN